MLGYVIMSKTEFYVTILYWLFIGLCIPPLVMYAKTYIDKMK